jgi:glutathione S-transferase
MSLRLYFHPLSSFCQKVLVALYENDTPFVPQIVNLMDPAEAAAFRKIWPIGRFPVLRDEAADRLVPESTIIIEYLAQYYPGRTRLVPTDPEEALQVRLQDRFYDLYLNVPMQRIVFDRLRPASLRDPQGVDEARALLRTALDIVERDMAGRTWATDDHFSMADCAAAPAMYYANLVSPFGETHRHAAAYLARLAARHSFARVLKEAEPYRAMFPQKPVGFAFVRSSYCKGALSGAGPASTSAALNLKEFPCQSSPICSSTAVPKRRSSFTARRSVPRSRCSCASRTAPSRRRRAWCRPDQKTR